MSIFGKVVDQITTHDLAELLASAAIEDVRLEFKRDVFARQEALKKVSSLANTFGGYIVIGAEANGSDGKLIGMPGISPSSHLKQQVVQWCFDGLYPPLEPFVSPPIPAPGDAQRECYVVYVEESEEAPHFLNARGGAYVRSSEFSQRFSPQLATYDELEHLSSRRARLVQRRGAMLGRAKERFATFAKLHYSETPGTVGGLGATFVISFCPVFPSTELRSPADLYDLFANTQVSWRQVGFPRLDNPITQHESVLLLRGQWGFSICEATTWGQLFYAREIEEMRSDDSGSPGTRLIHLWALMGHLLVILQHASVIYEKLGYHGSVSVHLELQSIRKLPFADFPNNRLQLRAASPLDDTVSFELRTSTSRLHSDRDGLAADIARTMFFALNWEAGARDDAPVKELLRKGHSYNNLR